MTATDWRLPVNRREAFLRFYEFHLRYLAHPGGVYYLLPSIPTDTSDRSDLWVAFVNGHSQHALTTSIIVDEFPDPLALDGLDRWWDEHHRRLGWDTDRRHHKQMFVEGALRDAARATDPEFWGMARSWRGAWKLASGLHTMGRLSTWSYIEFVTIMGHLAVEPTDLMLRDRDGSRSHRNGLCIVTGLDDYDWHQSNPGFDGKYPDGLVTRLDSVGDKLLSDTRWRTGKDATIDSVHVSYLTLESALCTYKSWHRPNRRYPNVYNDMAHDRIRATEEAWPERDFGWAWAARRKYLPEFLRLEDRPDDPGCVPAKQNHYRETGEVPMLGYEWPELFPCSLPGCEIG